jgi:hypothetical protein
MYNYGNNIAGAPAFGTYGGLNNYSNTFTYYGKNAIQGNLIEVSGINGVNALNLAPNSKVIAVDNTAPIIYLITTDSAGYKTPIAYDISPHIPEEQKQQNDFEARLSRLEEIINEQSAITESKPTTKRNKSANDTAD